MTDRTLTAVRQDHAAGATVVAVTGELDYHTAPELSRAVQEAPCGAGLPLLIDLTGLVYCDSTGISVLVAAYQRAQQANAGFALIGLNADLMRVFGIVGLDQLFSFHRTVEDAVATFGG